MNRAQQLSSYCKEPGMSTLHLSVLGSPQVLHGESHPSFSTRKELALLLYLAVEGGSHTRKHLTELLWPDSDATRGRAAFRITLLRLRDALGESATLNERAHLNVERDMLKLNMTDVTLDLHILQEAWMLVQQTPQSSTTLHREARQNAIYRLQQASLVWRGRFLDDFSLRDAPTFDDWIRSQHEFWQQRMRLILDRLALLEEEEGAIEQAISTLTHWMTLDALNEDIYRRLMRLYTTRGDRTNALQTY